MRQFEVTKLVFRILFLENGGCEDELAFAFQSGSGEVFLTKMAKSVSSLQVNVYSYNVRSGTPVLLPLRPSNHVRFSAILLPL